GGRTRTRSGQRRARLLRACPARERRAPSLSLLERGHHLLGEELEAAHLLSEGQETTRIQLGGDARQAELLLQETQSFDQRRRGTESHLAREDVVVAEHRQASRLIPTRGDRAGARAPEGLEGQAGLALHVVGDRLPGLLARGLLGRRG